MVALEYTWLQGPQAPAVGGSVAALLAAFPRGATAAVSSVGLGALMGLTFGMVRYGLGHYYTDVLEAAFPVKEDEEEQLVEQLD